MQANEFDQFARDVASAGSRRRLLKVLAAGVLSALLAPLVPPRREAAAQVQGATMTVLRGQVAVIHPDGSAVQPAPSGTTVSPGDEIRTLNNSDALITFFSGIEIELGEETILVVERVSRQGDRVDVSLRQVLGTTLNRVATFADPGSTYQIQAGGAVALVRGTRFLVGVTASGVVVIVVLEGQVVINPGTPGATTVGAGQTAYFTFEFVNGVPQQTGSIVVTRSEPDPAGGGYNELQETITFVEQEVLGGDANLSAEELAEIAGAADEDEDDDPCRGVRCSNGRTCCDGRCVETRSDREHCGRCGNRCGGNRRCLDGQCVDCPSDRVCGSRCCNGDERCCNGTCRNLQTDENHCGRCGRECPSGQTCSDGRCVGQTTTTTTRPPTTTTAPPTTTTTTTAPPTTTTTTTAAPGDCPACTEDSCFGQTPCGTGCTTLCTTENTCFCHASSSCGALTSCTSSSQCPNGWRCAFSCCPGGAFCHPPCGTVTPAGGSGRRSGPP